jgi:hypothetical protein
MKKIRCVLICLMLVSITCSVVSAVSVKKEVNVEPLDFNFLSRLNFNGKTSACLLRHYEFSRPVDFGIKWGFMHFSDAEITVGRQNYSGDGIIFMSHFLGKAMYNENNDHWTFDGFARCCFIKEL